MMQTRTDLSMRRDMELKRVAQNKQLYCGAQRVRVTEGIFIRGWTSNFFFKKSILKDIWVRKRVGGNPSRVVYKVALGIDPCLHIIVAKERNY